MFHRVKRGNSGRVIWLSLLTLILLPTVSRGSVTPQQVDASIKKGVAFIYSKQKPTGQWEPDLRRTGTEHAFAAYQGDTFGGLSALCTVALLDAGEKPSDPRLAKAISFLKTCDPVGIYVLGLRAMVWSRLPQTPENKGLLQQDATRLANSMLRKGEGSGLWGYLATPPADPKNENPNYDRSVSQFAVLGLWAAVQAGASVPPELWRVQDTVWRAGQTRDGAWLYAGTAESSSDLDMTCAGAATLLIVQDVLGSLNGGGGAAVPVGNDSAINRAVRRVEEMFDDAKMQGGYAWYGIERIGTAGGYRYIGKRDWYDQASTHLVSQQEKDGSWPPGRAVGSNDLVETAFNLLVLAHGRAPVLMTKLDYSGVEEGVARAAAWHQRPRDAANLVRYVGAQLEQSLNWQVVRLSSPLEDLLEAPVMFMAGGKTVVLTAAERAKLKAYLDQGGMIVASSEATAPDKVVGHDEFSKSILMLGQQLYPKYTFRLLPQNHPIYTDQQYKPARWKEQPTVWGLSNGVRELIVLLPQGDFGKTWNSNQWRTDSQKFEVGANILEYAVTREVPGSRGMGHYIKPTYWTEPSTRPTAANPGGTALEVEPLPANAPPANPPADAPASTPASAPASRPAVDLPPDTRYLTIGRLRVGDNWDPEPGAWVRMTTLLANNYHLFIDTQPVDAIPAQLKGLKLLHWTGTTAVHLNDSQRQAISNYLKQGGTLLVDAAGGGRDFAESSATELKAVLGLRDQELGVILPEDDPLYRLRDGKISRFRYRRYTTGKVTGKLDAPRLRGLDQGGRTILFFSREDLSAGCVGQNVDGIIGYSPQTATAIVRNIVLTAARKK